MEPINERTRTIEKGPDGRLRKAFSPDASDVKLWRDTIQRDGEEIEVAKIRVPVSSTGTDRDGDRFSEEGLEHMVNQYQSGEVPMFPNHGLDPETGWNEYRFEHKMGGWKDAEIEEEEGDRKVVYATGALSPDSEEAEKLEHQIENGVVPVTFSVGFMPINADTRTDEDGEPVGREFHEHDLFETSPVGIPANTDATVSAMASAAAKGVAVANGVEDPSTIKTLASTIEAEVKAGGSFRDVLQEHMEKEPQDAIPLVEAYLDAEERSGSDTLEEFLAWVEENDGDLGAAEDAAEAYLSADGSDAEDPSDATVADLGEWLVEEFGESDGDGEEGGDDDDEDDEEEEQNSPEYLSAEEHREIVRDELEPIRNELSELRDAVESLGAEEAAGEEEIEELRDELAELREQNEELERRLEEPKDPKGQRGGIVQAERGDDRGSESRDPSGDGIETTPRDGVTSHNDGDGLDRLAEQLADN